MSESQYALRSVISADGAAILDVGRGTITTLNESGAYIWQRLRRGEALESVLVNLALETGRDVADIEQDVRGFVEILRRSELLRDESGRSSDESRFDA
ncbi:PqqD family protein [Terriglobus roseus]|uniref:Coenzyme PQQ synthesis protein D (PqqD) n=1 Tax=Terriglobus roseus TaxID=392734 RepID=A0A1H4K1H9_9BACT|nr:PqqD family protein [Terriglobus roseus]SEB52253.1 Coenzyme PQQ synthesis protein D (PqqD) [Terriglobus roseus]